MPLNNDAVSLLISDDVAMFLFDEIVKHRSVMLKELTASLGNKKFKGNVVVGKTPVDIKNRVVSVVSRLKQADLIEESATPVTDFNSYYVTSNGLNTEKQLRLSGILA